MYTAPLPYNLNVAFDSSGEALLETVYMPRQPKAYKTFDHLPMKQLLALNCDRGVISTATSEMMSLRRKSNGRANSM